MSELFAGTADWYRRFRPPYPAEAFDWVVAQHELDGSGTLLDCGCGTGSVFVGLSRWFSKTIATDPDAAMLAAARLTAAYLFSTSFASKALLREQADGFERDLRSRLLELAPNGKFNDEIEHSIISARRQ